jgi:hypothetical protein
VANIIPPPKPPAVAAGDHVPSRRLQFRLWQVVVCSITVFVAGWCFTLHAAVGFTAAFLAKHVIVAVLAMGLGLEDEIAKR